MWAVATAIMVLAAGAKVLRGGFEPWLASTGMFPAWAIPAVARAMIGLEVLTAILLVWPRLRRSGWIVAGGLAAAFTTIHVAGILLGDVKPCRCFGVLLSHDALGSHLGMTALCVTLAAMAFVGARRARAPRTVFQGEAECASRTSVASG